MPEGDTIHRTAASLRRVLLDAEVTDAEGSRRLPDAETLVGTVVRRVTSRGKHLMIHFDGQRVLHSHMGMTGSWHIYRSGQPWKQPADHAAITIRTSVCQVVCFSPKLIELVSETVLRRNPWLRRLGPDLIVDELNEEIVIPRFRTQNSLAIGEVLMNQSVVSGIGNIYKSEVLFLSGVHPLTVVAELSDAQLLDLTMLASELLRKNSGRSRRTIRHAVTGGRFWVYGRQDQPCFRCGTSVRLTRQGDLGRTTFFCPDCQSRND